MKPPPGIAGFVERLGDQAAEITWEASLAMIERAARDAREAKWARFRWFPSGELRRLRRDLAHALELARFAVAMQEDETELVRELMADARAQAEEAGRRRRREQTMEAERVRLEKGRRRRQERS